MIVANGRILSDPMTGVQRYLRELLHFLEVPVISPKSPLHGIRGHLWEQLVLPRKVDSDMLWSPSNTGPIASSNQVVTIHDLAFLDLPHTMRPAFRIWYSALIPKLAKRVKHVITVSEFSRERLLYWSGVSPEKVTAIPNGVDLDRFTPDGERLRHDDYVLAVGTMEPRKNLEALIRAWPLVRTLSPETTLVVAGGVGKSNIFESAGVTIPTPGVQFVGRVSDSDLPALYRGARAVVCPSRYEGFGLPCLEAMASGAPVIYNDIPAFREVVGQAGLAVSIDDGAAVARSVLALDDRRERNHLTKAGIIRARQFSWKQCAQRTREVLEANA